MPGTRQACIMLGMTDTVSQLLAAMRNRKAIGQAIGMELVRPRRGEAVPVPVAHVPPQRRPHRDTSPHFVSIPPSRIVVGAHGLSVMVMMTPFQAERPCRG